jgi:hypothetical protein
MYESSAQEFDFAICEQECFDLGMAYARSLMEQVLNQLDLNLMTARDTKTYRHKGLRTTTFKTLMGEVNVKRRTYNHIDATERERRVYLLDDVISKDTIGNISMNLIQCMAEEITEKSYRGTAQAISSMTGQVISHTGVWNAIQALGDKISNMDRNRAIAARNFNYVGDKSVPLLMEEYDGIRINMQGKDRPQSGAQAEMKVSVTYEGKKVKGKNKNGQSLYKTVNPLFMVGFEKTNEFFEKKEGQLSTIYNLDEITDRLVNGDGASWIKTCQEKTGGRTYFQLDKFHIKREIKRSNLDKEIQNSINVLIEKHKISEALSLIKYHLNLEPEKDKKQKILDMYKYLKNHQDFIIPIKERGIEHLNEYEAIKTSNMGTVENVVCSVVALRMKKRRASFTKRGATNLGRLLSLKRSRLLNQTISNLSTMTIPMEYSEIVTTTLAAAKTPQIDGKGFKYPFESSIPLKHHFKTNGRNAIKGMMENKTFSELKYR